MKYNKQDFYDEMGLNKENVKLLNDYFEAFSNLYGKISLKSAFEIINEQNDSRFNQDTLIKFAKSKNREKRYYAILSPKDFYDDVDNFGPLDDEIVHEAIFAVDDEDYYKIDEAHTNKPICVLPKKELLKYADDLYWEETPETQALEKYIEENAEIVQPPVASGFEHTAHDVVEEYVMGVHLDLELDSMEMDALLRLIIPPEGKKEQEKFLNGLALLAMEVRNNTRMWANRGYTPKELSCLLGGPRLEDIKVFSEDLF